MMKQSPGWECAHKASMTIVLTLNSMRQNTQPQPGMQGLSWGSGGDLVLTTALGYQGHPAPPSQWHSGICFSFSITRTVTPAWKNKAIYWEHHGMWQALPITVYIAMHAIYKPRHCKNRQSTNYIKGRSQNFIMLSHHAKDRTMQTGCNNAHSFGPQRKHINWATAE